MIIPLIKRLQSGDSDATLPLIEKFNPLLKKYAYKLSYDDAYNDLLLDFIELLHSIRLEQIRNKTEGGLVTYIATSIRNSYIRKSKCRNIGNVVVFSSLSNKEMYYVDTALATIDNFAQHELPELNRVLTKSELLVLEMIYLWGYSVSDIAYMRGVSRQAVNQTKKRAINKLARFFVDKLS